MDSFLSDSLFKSFSSTVNMFISRFMIQILHIFKMYRKGKDIRKKETNQVFKLPNLCGNQLIST
jgi:hypothetical protein